MKKFLPVFLLLVGVTHAQEEAERGPLVTDRPSFTTGPGLMPAGQSQLELGWTYTEKDDFEVHTGPEVLFRHGLNEAWELRLGWEGYSFVDGGEFAGDTFIGAKYRFAEQEGDMPAMALIGTLVFPSGHDSGIDSDDDVYGSLLLGWDYQLDDKSSLAGNLGLAVPQDDLTGDHFAQGVFSLMYSRSLDDKTTCFGEFYTNFPAADEEDAEYVMQAGLTYLLNNDMQIDFRAGFGLNEQAEDWHIGAGLAYRF